MYDHKYRQEQPASLTLMTGAGVKEAVIVERSSTDNLALQSQLDLGRLTISPTPNIVEYSQLSNIYFPSHQISLYQANIGNPHAIFLLPLESPKEQDIFNTISDHSFAQFGQFIQTHPLFTKTNGVNLTMVTVNSAQAPYSISVRTFERGGNGETHACGTGISATASVCVVQKWLKAPDNEKEQLVHVTSRGGKLSVLVQRLVDASTHEEYINAKLAGPAEEVFSGSFTLRQGWNLQ